MNNHCHSHRSRPRIALHAILASLLCLYSRSAPAAETLALAPDLVLARTKNGELRVRDLEPVFAAMAPLDTSSETLQLQMRQPPATLAFVAREHLANIEIAREYRASHPAIPKTIRDEILLSTGQEILKRNRADVEKQMGEISDDEARAHYEKSKFEFLQPLTFHMRHLALTKYERYVAQPGDTLESVAAKISGTTETVQGILTDAEGKMRRWVAPEDRRKFPFKPLAPGERLLVPMSPATKQAVRGLLEREILPQLKQGKTFEQLCKEFSEGEDKGQIIGPLPFGNSPMLPEIIEAARTLPIGEVSPVIETTHGFEALQIVSRQDERLRSFEETSDTIKLNLKKNRILAEHGKRLAEIWKIANLDMKPLGDPKAPENAVVVAIGSQKWSKKDLQDFLGPGVADVTDAESFQNLVSADSLLFANLLVAYADRTDYFKDPGFRKRIDLISEGILAQMAVKEAQENAAAAIGEKDARAFYDNHLADFTPPKTFKLRQIVARFDPRLDLSDPEARARAGEELLEKLRRGARGVRSQQDFFSAVQKLSNDDAGRGANGWVGEVNSNYKPGAFADVLNSLEPGKPSEPFLYGNLAYVLWADEIVAPAPTPFDQIQRQILDRRKEEVRRQTATDMIAKTLERIEFSSSILPAAEAR